VASISPARRPARARSRLAILAAAMALLVGLLPGTAPVALGGVPGVSELFFSEYIEGSSNNKALEIYNGTGASVNLATGGYSVQMFFNGSATAGLTINLTGTVADEDVYVLAQSSANATILAQADQTNGAGWYNGDDAVVVRKGTTIIDAIGQIGFDPGTEWGTGLTSTADNTLRRKAFITAGDTDGSNGFDPAIEWDGFATDTFGGLGSHTVVLADQPPAVSATVPANGATGVVVDTDISITFNEPVNVSGDWYSISCTLSGAHTATVSGGTTTFTLNPVTDFTIDESCTVTIESTLVTDQDTNDPPDTMAFNFSVGFSTLDPCTLGFTAIPLIQGSGETTPIPGTVVTTEGVVVGDYEGPSPTLRGFYLQDPTGDGDAATSDGIFVFNGNANSVSLGEVVRVTGTASDFQDQTQISSSAIVKCGTDTVTPTDVSLPFASATGAERWEGMLVRLPQTLSVTEHFQLGRFGQVVVSSGGRLAQPTNVVSPGAPALALQAANNLNRLIIDDHLQNQNPDPILFGRGGLPLSASNTLRGGDTATGIVGVMTYTWAGNSASPNAYRVRPINALDGSVEFLAANARPAAAPARTGTTRVAGMNLLNYYNTFDGSSGSPPWACTLGVGGALTDCRGADSAAEFDRQWPKTVAAILALDADAVGLVELENDGYGPDSSIADLVGRLNAATAPGTWAFVDADAGTGQLNALGVDAIKVGLIYRPANLTLVGQTAALNTLDFVNAGDSILRNRAALAQSFQDDATGGRITLVVNHLKSKGNACDLPDAGDGQGNCNDVRTRAATVLAGWLATDPTGVDDPDVLILGDLNSYAMEDPITALGAAGYGNLVAAFSGPDAYSYVFDGQWGYLDHALGTATLASQVTAVADWHINADEPSVLDYNTNFKSAGQIVSLYAPDATRVSDHDPLIVDLVIAYPFGGFLSPVDGGAVNTAKAGSAIPVKFSLGGDRGLNIFAPGSPASEARACELGAPSDAVEQTVTAGGSSLQYDPLTETYTYVWKTEKAWAGTCRTLLLRLNDGQTYTAEFHFFR
jgi:predicted extracellular nuclease